MPKFPSKHEKLYLRYLSDLMMQKYSDPRWMAGQALREQGTDAQRRIQNKQAMEEGVDIQGTVRGLPPDVEDESGVRSYGLRNTDKLLEELRRRRIRPRRPERET